MRSIFLLLAALLTLPTFAVHRMANVVCFVRFADQDENSWQYDFDYYERMFNDDSDGANSVYNYFHDMSFGRMEWKSSLVRLEYVDTHNSGYFREKSDMNPEGYSSMDLLLDTRVKTLVKDMCAAIDPQLPEETVTDADGDGIVDNLVIVICGNSDISASRMLWPANNISTNSEVKLKGAVVRNYLKVFDGANGYSHLVAQEINTGVLCHEMTHTLNAYDLYARKNSKITPVGVWDLMSDNGAVPQEMSAYTRIAYGRNFGGWIDDSEVGTLTENGEYSIAPLSSQSPENVVWKIKPDPTRQEYFLIEYRDKSSIWDQQLPNAGLMVYRVNPSYNGNTGDDNKYELYVFRPDGSTTAGGSINRAPLGRSTGRYSFGAEGDTDYPFYEDGTRANFSLSDIREEDGKMTFRYGEEVSGTDRITTDGSRDTDMIYTFQGIRINKITIPGTYIVNGRKVRVNRP